jgi:hypothetical protein
MRVSAAASLALAAPFAVTAFTPCLNARNVTDPLNISPKMARETLNTLRTRDTVIIDLWIHVLAAGPTAADGYVDATGILTQVNWLQEQYAPWGFQFQVKPITYALNAEWASDVDPQLAEKQKQLHRGDYTALNLYLVKGAGGGQCTLPIGGDEPLTQEQLDGDGCLVPLASGIHAPDGTVTHESMFYSFLCSSVCNILTRFSWPLARSTARLRRWLQQ